MVYDLIVIGAGPGGSSAAKEASKLGMKVALINGGKVGGTCLNTGCMPTKSLYESVKKGLNFNSAMDRAKSVVSDLSHMSARLRDLSFDFFDKKVVKVEEGKIVLDDSTVLKTKFVILATGSSPNVIPGVDSTKLITNENFLDLEVLPAKLAIVGGGYIGLEFANIFSSLGSEVDIFEVSDRILMTEDMDCLKEVMLSLKSRGVNFNFNTSFDGGDFDKVFVATGRSANVSLVKGIVNLDKGVVVNATLKSSVDWLYAVGDCVNLPYRLAHVAEREGLIAARNISIFLKLKDKTYFDSNALNLFMDYSSIPTRVFVDPLISSVGMKEFDLDEGTYLVGRSWFKGNGMSYCKNDLRGFVKVLIDKKSCEILGAVSVGEIDLHELGLAISAKISAKEILSLIHFHPSNQELIPVAIKNAFKD